MSEELCKFCTGVHFSIANTNLTIIPIYYIDPVLTPGRTLLFNKVYKLRSDSRF
ncbi:unnamed protein product [Nesidiocoris tenuis]|uniref:Uncharacterized protein n=1 Tax=Nesidiocoris tenuis TaxID=355587 RepID=A0A6H5HJA0_9HEMI|nr:unnamed protein product [Nesidiocoris tenuis]